MEKYSLRHGDVFREILLSLTRWSKTSAHFSWQNVHMPAENPWTNWLFPTSASSLLQGQLRPTECSYLGVLEQQETHEATVNMVGNPDLGGKKQKKKENLNGFSHPHSVPCSARSRAAATISCCEPGKRRRMTTASNNLTVNKSEVGITVGGNSWQKQ